jgi:hypothetical protein
VDILVDSSYYVAQQRARVDYRRQLAPWIQAGSLWTCGIIRVEVLRGIRDQGARGLVSDFLDVLNSVPVDDTLCGEAANLAWSLDRKGAVVPVTDLLIAQCARSIGAVLVTLDDHFRLIPGLQWRRDLP